MRKSSIKSKGLHEWSKNDTILTLFFTKWGNKGIFLKTPNDLAKFIGVSLSSLVMQSANIRTLLGDTERVLSDYSKLQSEVFEEFNGLSYIELLKVVKKIINQDDFERSEILRKMGRDPKKMVMVSN